MIFLFVEVLYVKFGIGGLEVVDLFLEFLDLFLLIVELFAVEGGQLILELDVFEFFVLLA